MPKINESALVSVLLTTYNRQQYIAEAIESVLVSTYQNWELIVVDDCSVDNTVAIAKQYAERDHRIRLYTNESNLGDYPNRNRAASYASGRYLKYVDSDDRIEPDALQRMVSFMDAFPDAGFGLSELSFRPQEAYPIVFNRADALKFHYTGRPIFFASPGLSIIRRESFEAVGGFPEKRMVGDFEMWHKLSLLYPLVLMPGNLYWSRKHEGQEVAEQNKFIEEYEKIKIKYLFSAQSPFSYKDAKLVINNRKKTLLKIFLRKLFALQFSEASVRLRVYFFYLRRFHQLKKQA